jgi:hypothetical protein
MAVSTLEEVTAVADGGDPGGHLQCPFCNSYDVCRLFLASLNLDSCECASCGARWDEECGSGEYRGRADRSSVMMPRTR